MRPKQLLHQLVDQKFSSFCLSNVTYFTERYFAAFRENAPLRCRAESLEACLVLVVHRLKAQRGFIKACKGLNRGNVVPKWSRMNRSRIAQCYDLPHTKQGGDR